MGLLSRAQAWLNDTLAADAGSSLSYTRAGGATVALTCRAGRSQFSADDRAPKRVEWAERDYLIEVADFAAAFGSSVKPSNGDRIAETINGVACVFEVKPPSGETGWRFSDNTRTVYRVHTKRVS